MNHFSFSDLKVGMKQQFTRSVGQEMIEQFVELSADTSPIHVDDDYARERGFASRVAHGLLTSSLYSTLVGVHLPGAKALLLGIDVAFYNPAYAGDTLTCQGEVQELHESVQVAEIAASITNQNGQRISKAKIKVAVRG